MTGDFSDLGLKYLSDLKNLRILFLNSAHITSDGLQVIKKLESIKEVTLTNTRVDKSILKLIEPLKQLTTLILDGTEVTEGDVDSFREQHPTSSVDIYLNSKDMV